MVESDKKPLTQNHHLVWVIEKILKSKEEIYNNNFVVLQQGKAENPSAKILF